ncbi:hypothetical protein [Brazilian marseillevirus]|uniref:hypothetical protein n=1 Tax=Brazilian marseillevirus TaxID=1813599 RepID=UPI000783E6BA|nr:hypothetical protein A3303_gp071 [Brazilian marseillevirus]AMQ10579.1 hypothetical protein [Brazilian marseillevirus]
MGYPLVKREIKDKNAVEMHLREMNHNPNFECSGILKPVGGGCVGCDCKAVLHLDGTGVGANRVISMVKKTNEAFSRETDDLESVRKEIWGVWTRT